VCCAKLGERIARHLPRAAVERTVAVLGPLADTSTSQPAPMPPVEAVESAWVAWLSAECAARPVLWVLDDLHAADAASGRVVDATLRRLDGSPLCILALGRPETHARFPELWDDCPLHVVRLGALLRRAGEELVRAVLGARARPDVVARLVERAAGHPHHLHELARAYGSGLGEGFPEAVLESVEARLDTQGPEAKRILRAASIFGERFSRAGVAALTGTEPSYIGERLDEIAGRELVGPGSSIGRAGDADYVFRHAVVREAAYATLTDADRALGHRLAAEWLERQGRAEASALAAHRKLGGVR